MSDPSPTPPHDPQESIFDMGISQKPAGKNSRRKHWTGSPPSFKLIVLGIVVFLALMVVVALKESPKTIQHHPKASGSVADEESKPTLPPSPAAEFAAPVLKPRTLIGQPDLTSYDLPVYSESTGWDTLVKTIQVKGAKPDIELVRTEDLLSRFQLRPTGPTAVSRGVTLSTESISSPWRPSATLFLVSLKGALAEDHVVSLTYKPASSNVARFRVIGFTTSPDPAFVQPKPTKLAARAIATLVIEVEPSITATEMGSIVWSVDNQPAGPVSLSRRTEIEPSDDARMAALICAYSQWLRNERPELIDAELVAALARELAGGDLSPDHAELLNMIDRSLHF